MKYFDQMDDKHGFDDGENIPIDAFQCRKVYLAAMNRALEHLGSAVRLIPFNRPGSHNVCLFLRCTVEQYEKWKELCHQYSGDNYDLVEHVLLLVEKEQPIDDAYTKAVELCDGLELDDLVVIKVHIDEKLLAETLADDSLFVETSEN